MVIRFPIFSDLGTLSAATVVLGYVVEATVAPSVTSSPTGTMMESLGAVKEVKVNSQTFRML